MSRNVKGVYPGTFDPPTRGHLDIIGRALHVVDELIVGVATNAGKGPMFSLDERVSLIRQAIADMDGDAADRVRIQPFDNLLMHFTVSCGASVIVRGLRAVSDFESELQMAQMNTAISGVQTLFLPTASRRSFMASRLIREVARLGGDVSQMVPDPVRVRLEKRFPG